MPVPGDTQFVTNKWDKINQVQSGTPSWSVAYGRELTETDAIQGAVAAGVSIFIDDPAPFEGWLDDLIDQSITVFQQNVQTVFTQVVLQQAIQLAMTTLKGLLGGNPQEGVQSLQSEGFEFKAGVSEYNGQNQFWVPNLSPDGGFWQTSSTTLSYCPYVAVRAVQAIPSPHPSTPTEYVVARFINKSNSNLVLNFTWHMNDSSKSVTLQPGATWYWYTEGTPQFWNLFQQRGPECQITPGGVIIEFPAPPFSVGVNIINTTADPHTLWSTPSSVDGKIKINHITMNNEFQVFVNVTET